MNHASECAFSVSFGDEGCDCNGPDPHSETTHEERLAVARQYLARARDALRRPA